jgi:hypothetical protein
MLSAPAAPGAFAAPPTPTFAPPCPTCGPTPSAGFPAPPQVFGGPHSVETNYSQLFNVPPMAPPVDGSGNQFLMPTPLDQSEIPRSEPMPPHYDQMETPAKQVPTPAPMPPMNPTNPMPHAAPMAPPMPMNAQPMPTPAGPEAMNPSFPHIFAPPVSQQGAAPIQRPYIDSRRQDGNQVRL